ncbi:MAG TPA: hypothetical protein VI199_03525 [Novosphingobium sp.]
MAPDIALLLALRQRLYAVFGALLLATACLQAVGPITAPLERTPGSAFSAATVDVAVVRPRSGEALRLAPLPAPLPAARRPEPWPLAVRPQVSAVPVRPDSTGPPPADPLAVQPGPRAPPRF